MKKRKLKPASKPLPPLPDLSWRKIRYAFGAYHNFWFFREGERGYNDYRDLSGRKDAPVQISMDVIGMLPRTLTMVPTVNPGERANYPSVSLNSFGVTIINETGGQAFSEVCRKAAQEWAQGSEVIVFTSGTYSIEGSSRPPKPYHFKINRDPLVRDLETIAGWGEQAATGKFFILHLGV